MHEKLSHAQKNILYIGYFFLYFWVTYYLKYTDILLFRVNKVVYILENKSISDLECNSYEIQYRLKWKKTGNTCIHTSKHCLIVRLLNLIQNVLLL